MKTRVKLRMDRHDIVHIFEKEYDATIRLVKIVIEKIKQTEKSLQPTVDVLLVRKEIEFHPKANIEEILRILQFENDFEAYIKVNHSFSCNCTQYDAPCCRWLTVNNTWTF